MDDKRILEAEHNIKNYLSEGILKKSKPEKEIINILKKNSLESLRLADFLFNEEKSDLWVIVISYYSMFYIANAYLLSIGYKVGDKISHKVTADSLMVFARDKLKKSLFENYEESMLDATAQIKADDLIQSFDYERIKRSRIQYRTKEEAKHSKANTSLLRAKEFSLEIEKIIEE